MQGQLHRLHRSRTQVLSGLYPMQARVCTKKLRSDSPCSCVALELYKTNFVAQRPFDCTAPSFILILLISEHFWMSESQCSACRAGFSLCQEQMIMRLIFSKPNNISTRRACSSYKLDPIAQTHSTITQTLIQEVARQQIAVKKHAEHIIIPVLTKHQGAIEVAVARFLPARFHCGSAYFGCSSQGLF